MEKKKISPGRAEDGFLPLEEQDAHCGGETAFSRLRRCGTMRFPLRGLHVFSGPRINFRALMTWLDAAFRA